MPPTFDRRTFLETTAAAVLSAGALSAAPSQPARPKAPFRVLYSNDTTNVTGCVSPFHKKGEPFRAKMLEASVDEVAGRVDAHFLQPGLGMVPMWPSKVLPLESHYAWIKQRYGQRPDSFGAFVLAGGDVVQTFVDRCRTTGPAAFISFRLNDAHHKEYADPSPGDKPGTSIGMSVTRHYVEHPEYRLKQGSKRNTDLVQNWAIADVRAQKFALITELCENYDLDGLELDFMRWPYFFIEPETTLEQRCSIITGFVAEIRALLDRTARGGRRRWLCARVPCLVKALGPVGLDLPAMIKAGLDMVNMSASYFTTQRMDFAALRKLSAGATLYGELCHSVWNGEKLIPGYDTNVFRRASKEQLQTTAHLAYARGADGVSLFNFAYYREHGSAGRGPFSEPPFDLLPHLGDRDWLASQPQHFFLAKGWSNSFVRPPLLPRSLDTSRSTRFGLDLAPPKGGWQQEARLRIQTLAPLAVQSLTAKLNGHELAIRADVAEPFDGIHPALLGQPAQLRAWSVPAALLVSGNNVVEFTLSAGKSISNVFIDLTYKPTV